MFDPQSVNLERGYLEADNRELFDGQRDVWILGRRFQSTDLESINRDVYSKIWITYRKNFSPIGGTGPTSDQGWGCMLRCGQMVMAQALLNRHLGREWSMHSGDDKDTYRKILKMFQDSKSSCYSIHQIAKMGETEGKTIGEWFGPSTIAHVLKKLVVHDDWTSLAVHVAMDNILFLEDVERLCSNDGKRRTMHNRSASTNIADKVDCSWIPLLLIFPLRLGLTQLNACYIGALQACFTNPYSLGMIGGRPNHALYFIGICGQQLLYLDPHVCQQTVNMEDEHFDDSSYHTENILHISVMDIDPSVALAFYFDSRPDLDNFVRNVASRESNALFEVLPSRPKDWPAAAQEEGEQSSKSSDFFELDSHESDEDFEMLN